MPRLTEDMIKARSKICDLQQVKKLNCWGTDIDDISIVEEMRNIEVLALSVNRISSLEPLVHCKRLKELYLRNNKIQDMSELSYLTGLKDLRCLWMTDNPCCEQAGDNYRISVLRALPKLQKLDNADVTPQELEEAKRQGLLEYSSSSSSSEQTPESPSPAPSPCPSPPPPSLPSSRCSPTPSPPGHNFGQLNKQRSMFASQYMLNQSEQQLDWRCEQPNARQLHYERNCNECRIHESDAGRLMRSSEPPTAAQQPRQLNAADRSEHLLTTTLYLLDELDYASLDKLQQAVRCRMDELRRR
ncbi:cilia- and flagella-associated protein 410-like [Drosophila busckii]|uniref:cilia- and flagella-associated protein 410-like n=1 Tax=Drosophila busckii TaxID=30019 RepID=UPI00083F0E8E|nr:cilia- and flagella-associated protein 410-like [Drosophila busckii]